jgi:hypothetical protein
MKVFTPGRETIISKGKSLTHFGIQLWAFELLPVPADESWIPLSNFVR